MKRNLVLAVAVGTALMGCNQQATGDADEAAKPMTLDSTEQKVSYLAQK